MRYVIFLLLLTITSVGIGQSRLDKFEPTYQKSKSLVMAKNYTVNFTMVYDNSRREQINSNTNSISINQFNSSGRLASFSNRGIIFDFNGAISNYKVNFDDNRKLINISYDLINNGKSKFIELAIKPSGNVILLLKKDSGKSTSWIGNLAD
ncbi:DUF4251 domain-containing protein [uncultured Winogradskyella sp.]|uniref:DUF4251 domain-containing protein n=1 Tax=uncultured Winogradskyella sp. TaxID=395353 RepID=UPI003517AB15